jgi:hypothetical protein
MKQLFLTKDYLMKSIIIAAALSGLAPFAAANDSACGKTTNGMPMRAKAQQVNLNDPSTLYGAFGPPQLETTTDDGKRVTIWYDILHENRGTATAYFRTDCGVLMAIIKDGSTIKTTMKGLLAEDIDLLLAGKSPNL